MNLCNVFLRTGFLEEARANLEEGLGILRRVHGERHPSVALAFNQIATVLKQQGEYHEALEMYKKALKIQRRVLGKDHEHVALTLQNMGSAYFDPPCSNYGEAVRMWKEAVAVWNRVLGIDNQKSAFLHYFMAAAKDLSGDAEGALDSVSESVRIYALFGLDNEDSRLAANLLRYLNEKG
jgi:tetratricopeptide (TPR) repeat protein